jgi:hypothetical protein
MRQSGCIQIATPANGSFRAERANGVLHPEAAIRAPRNSAHPHPDIVERTDEHGDFP